MVDDDDESRAGQIQQYHRAWVGLGWVGGFVIDKSDRWIKGSCTCLSATLVVL